MLNNAWKASVSPGLLARTLLSFSSACLKRPEYISMTRNAVFLTSGSVMPAATRKARENCP